MPIRTLEWIDGKGLELLDQTLLPTEEEYFLCEDVETVALAIERLSVRGAPAIGVSAAYGVVVGAMRAQPDSVRLTIDSAIERLRRTRPTAVNLFWALDRMAAVAATATDADLVENLLAEARYIEQDDLQRSRAMGRFGAELIPDESTVMTHCNAGGLATSGYGTALGVFYAAQEMGKRLHVYADETRPLLQGARLTAWELSRSDIPVTVICDNMSASVMRRECIDAIFVGADRIAANGDAANKIGTYGLAIIAAHHSVPFYVVAPMSTVDISLGEGSLIPIEERNEDEVRRGMGKQTVPDDAAVHNPAFDVTPADLITGIVTEYGVARAPFDKPLAMWSAEEK
jgi:methylthioribose-1-phosphate isomerase